MAEKRNPANERLIQEIARRKGVDPDKVRGKFEEVLARPVSRRLCIDPDDFTRPEEITPAQWKHVDECSFCQIIAERIRMVPEELLVEREDLILDLHKVPEEARPAVLEPVATSRVELDPVPAGKGSRSPILVIFGVTMVLLIGLGVLLSGGLLHFWEDGTSENYSLTPSNSYRIFVTPDPTRESVPAPEKLEKDLRERMMAKWDVSGAKSGIRVTPFSPGPEKAPEWTMNRTTFAIRFKIPPNEALNLTDLSRTIGPEWTVITASPIEAWEPASHSTEPDAPEIRGVIRLTWDGLKSEEEAKNAVTQCNESGMKVVDYNFNASTGSISLSVMITKDKSLFPNEVGKRCTALPESHPRKVELLGEGAGQP